MKKRLKRLVPLATLLALVLVLLCVLLPYYSGRGEVILTGYGFADHNLVRVQVRESGARQAKLMKVDGSDLVFSPNGRYMAFMASQGRDPSVTLLYDLINLYTEPIRVEASYAKYLATDTGNLVYWSNGLRCHDGRQEYVLDERCSQYEPVILENTVYYFRERSGSYDLYACDLPNGTPRLVGVAVQPDSLQACAYEGRHYLTAARSHTLTGSFYDQVMDDCGEEKDELRQILRQKAVSETVCNLYRFSDGVETLLAENVVGNYYVEPVTGTVVHQISTLARPMVALSEVQGLNIPNRSTWFVSNGGEPQELIQASSITPVLSPKGSVYFTKGKVLYRWPGSGEPEKIRNSTANFFLLMEESGAETLYIRTTSGTLLENGTQIAEGITYAYFAAEQLPGGAYRRLDEAILLDRQEYDPLPNANPHYTPALYASTFSLLKNGQETLLARGRQMTPKLLMANGDVLVSTQNGWYALSEGRAEQLPISHSIHWATGIPWHNFSRIAWPKGGAI